MKYVFYFKLEKPLILPIQYNHIMQAALLNWINEETYQTFLHQEGYSKEKRSYKLYTFSKIFGKFQLNKDTKRITFQEEIHFYVSSYDRSYLNYLVQNIINDKPLDIIGNQLYVSKIMMEQEKVPQTQQGELVSCLVKTVSPVTMASTLADFQGKKKTYYYAPMEHDFSELIKKNLIHKYEAFHGEKPDNTEFSIRAVQRDLKESITKYKNFIVKGWNGTFCMEGSQELIQIALDAGIGARNSAGYGCVLLQKDTMTIKEGIIQIGKVTKSQNSRTVSRAIINEFQQLYQNKYTEIKKE
ncbi:CRISPR-associated endoribonuclease Cas6 [Anaeromicropila populeti]|uniref:CRISPR-associated protein, Cas6 family n=1 Tax=Anaeromicropila populeti TaxID=37658 RepID=A0A1I6KLV7_9FIRM|nr:CRISPR-associated endoribonuclease Cas6 [Anaeromicropila populeti]SFR92179.1 CRISPR-associated protein, Cas6 family [Anaeromicropila populeti]